MISSCTETFSRISSEFTFDRSLLCTKVYSNSSPKLIDLLRRRMKEENNATVPKVEGRRPSIIVDKVEVSKALDLLVMGDHVNESHELMHALNQSKNSISEDEKKRTEIFVAEQKNALPTAQRRTSACIYIRSKTLNLRFIDTRRCLESDNQQVLHDRSFKAFGIVYAMKAPCWPNELKLRDLYNKIIEKAESTMNNLGLSNSPVFVCLVGPSNEFDEKKKLFCKLLRRYVEESSMRHKLYVQYFCLPLGHEVEQYVVGKCVDQIIQRGLRAGIL